MEFVWDEAKNETNRRKHGISFEEASDLFLSGTDYLEIFDETHSIAEDRFLAIGLIAPGVIVIVCTEVREGVVRIIGARRATKRETERYWRYMEETK